MSAHRQAAAAYRAVQALDARPAAVLAAAHQQLAAALDAALLAHAQRAFDRMCRCNEEAIRLLCTLTAAVEGHSPEADRLVGMYARLRTALNRMLFDPKEIEMARNGHVWATEMSRMFRREMK